MLNDTEIVGRRHGIAPPGTTTRLASFALLECTSPPTGAALGAFTSHSPAFDVD